MGIERASLSVTCSVDRLGGFIIVLHMSRPNIFEDRSMQKDTRGQASKTKFFLPHENDWYIFSSRQHKLRFVSTEIVAAQKVYSITWKDIVWSVAGPTPTWLTIKTVHDNTWRTVISGDEFCRRWRFANLDSLARQSTICYCHHSDRRANLKYLFSYAWEEENQREIVFQPLSKDCC